MLAEDKLILCCARTEILPSGEKTARKLLSTLLGWEYIYQASLHHGVLPLVYSNLQKLSPGSLSDSLQQKMKSHLRNTVVCNMHMGARLLKILALFEEHGIGAVPFKGPVLAEDVYGDLGLRNFSDLDILVSPHDAERAIHLLTSQGFTQNIQLTSSQFSSYMKGEDDMVLVHQKDNLVVELHWEMSGRYLSRPLDLAYLHGRLRTVSLLDSNVPSLSNEDQLLYLCVHGTRHMWSRLEWICCVAELIRNKKELEWDMLFTLADQMKCYRIVCHGLSLAHDLLDANLPVEVAEKLTRDPLLPKLAAQVTQQLFPLGDPGQTRETGYRFKRLQFQVRDSFLEQLRYGWNQLTLPREADWRCFPLPGSLSFLYIFFRPLRLLWELTKRNKL